MAYTIDIADGSTTYTFDNATASKVPKFVPRIDGEYNDEVTPPVLVADVETWTLEDCAFVGAESAVTGDVTTIRSLLFERLTPVNSVKFKRDGSTVYELETATGYKGGIQVRSLEPARGGPGQWATHWIGTIVIVARKLHADGDGIVRKTRRKSFTYDAANLATVRESGTVTTAPGTSAETKARTLALASPGAAYGLASGQPNVDVTDDTDTSASYETVWVEHGVSLPGGVNDYDLVVETQEVPGEGEVVTTTVRAKGPTLAQQKTAAQNKKPTTALGSSQEGEDRTAKEYRATYVQRRPSAKTKERNSSEKVVYRRREFQVQGQEEGEKRDAEVYHVPGFEPVFVHRPRAAKRVSERVAVHLRGEWSALADFGVGPKAGGLAGLLLQPGETRISGPTLDEPGITRDADLWRVEAEYVYLAAKVDFAAVAKIALVP